MSSYQIEIARMHEASVRRQWNINFENEQDEEGLPLDEECEYDLAGNLLNRAPDIGTDKGRQVETEIYIKRDV